MFIIEKSFQKILDFIKTSPPNIFKHSAFALSQFQANNFQFIHFQLFLNSSSASIIFNFTCNGKYWSLHHFSVYSADFCLYLKN